MDDFRISQVPVKWGDMWRNTIGVGENLNFTDIQAWKYRERIGTEAK